MMTKALVRSLVLTLLGCSLGFSAGSSSGSDFALFRLSDVLASPISGGGLLFTGNDVVLQDVNGNSIGDMDVIAVIGKPNVPLGSFLAATIGLSSQERIDIAKVWLPDGRKVSVAASLLGGQQTPRNADLHFLGGTGLFVFSNKLTRPLTPPLPLSNAFRTNAPPTDLNLGNAVMRYRNPPNEWNIVPDLSVALRMGTDFGVSFATAYMSGSIDLKEPDAGDGRTRIMVGCLTTPDRPLWCVAGGLGQWRGFGGQASSITAASLGLNPAEFPFASLLNVTYQPEASCPAGALPQQASQVSLVGGRVGQDFVVAAGWSPVPCATGYRAELIGNDGHTIATRNVRRTSFVWDQIDISFTPVALRLTPYNGEGDGQALDSSISFGYDFVEVRPPPPPPPA